MQVSPECSDTTLRLGSARLSTNGSGASSALQQLSLHSRLQALDRESYAHGLANVYQSVVRC